MSSICQDFIDSELLASIGDSMMEWMMETFTFSILYGVFVLLFSLATATYIKRKHSNRAQNWMFFATTITFILATIFEAALLAITRLFVYPALVGYKYLPLVERGPLVNAMLANAEKIISCIAMFEPIISDSIVIWRAFVLLQHRRWMVILPSLLFLASVASSLVVLVFECRGANVDFGLPNRFYAATIGLSLGTNVIATALIGYVYWLHRKDMVAGLGRSRPTQAERVLALLVESGVVFCIPQAASVILGISPQPYVPGSARLYASDVFSMAYIGFSAMYPTIVIALVNTQRTFDHVYSANTSLRTNHGGEADHITTIRFGQPDPVNSVETPPQQVEKNRDTQAV